MSEREMPGRPAVGRREFLLLAGAGAIAAVAVACTRGGSTRTAVTGPTSSGSIDAISQDAIELALINAQIEMPTDRSTVQPPGDLHPHPARPHAPRLAGLGPPKREAIGRHVRHAAPLREPALRPG